jgi:diguanylate cyclase (GGDEF)-like protein
LSPALALSLAAAGLLASALAAVLLRNRRLARAGPGPGRAACIELLRQALPGSTAGARPLAVLVLDCDRFKFINDAHGYAVGDLLLDQVARRIEESAPRPHRLARAGGDEFVLLMDGLVQPPSALAAAAAVLDAFDAPLMVAGRAIYTSVSIGIALAPRHGVAAEALLTAAECALREAKRAGRQTARIYDPQLGERDARRARALQLLHFAHDAGQLTLHYQPKVHLATGSCSGFEALLRLRTPLGLEGPGPLIDAAERSGFISKLGEWVFKEAADQSRAWRVAGITLPIAVNLSAKQLQDPRFMAFIDGQLGLDPQLPRHLQLEITESALAMDQIEFAGVLTRLRRLGFHIQADDFGTGYSTMGFLSKMAIDTLKIDRSFIAGLPEAQDNQQIVRAMLSMAHELKLSVVAEGIETPAQARWLQHQACDQGQGFLFARALPPAEAAQFAREGARAFLVDAQREAAVDEA